MGQSSNTKVYRTGKTVNFGGAFIPALSHFMYEVNDVYAITLTTDGRTVSDYSVTNESERNFLYSLLPEDKLKEIAQSVENNFVEGLISIATGYENIVSEAIVLRIDGVPKGVTIVTGILSESVEGIQLPVDMKITNIESYEQVVELTVKLMDEYIMSAANEQRALMLLDEMQKDSSKLEADYIRSSLITDIVQMLESEKDIVKIVEDIFKMVCEYLDIEAANLYRINTDNVTVSVISEYASSKEFEVMDKEQDVPLTDYPFFKEDNYIISSNTSLKAEQREFLDKNGIKAYIVFPIVLKGDVIMYLAFKCLSEERIFQMETVRFISDVRKILQSIITKRVAQNSLTSSLTSLEDILSSMECAIYVIDPITRELLFSNDVFDESLKNALSNIRLVDLFADGRKVTEYEVKALKKWLEISQKAINWVDGRPVELYTIYDITKNKMYEYSIEKSNNSDFLTGLFNRSRCEQDLEVYLNLMKDTNENGAFIFMDMDDFKHINDGLGHQYGDILLKAIATNIRHVRGIENTCYRVGGDEFVCIVPSFAYGNLDTIVNTLVDIFSHPWFLKGGEYYCTMSMGICKFPHDANTVEDVIRKADIALTEAKRNGKNQFRYYNEQTTINEVKRLDMEKYLRIACAHPEEEFEVYYQPIINVLDGNDECVGAEALVRWNSKELGRLKPGDFIPLAESLGLISSIGDFVLKEACKACKHWNEMGHPDFKVNVNFSVVQLLQTDMKDKIKQVLDETGLTPKNLTLEVTESLAINDISYMKKLLKSIREYGVRVALDDFGTGYSSLNHIHEMPIDIIKVDRCFVRDIGKDEYSQTFVKMVTELAKVMDMNVCVEGVEEENQLDKVRKNKVDMIQGFYFAEPMPFDEFEMKFVS